MRGICCQSPIDGQPAPHLQLHLEQHFHAFRTVLGANRTTRDDLWARRNDQETTSLPTGEMRPGRHTNSTKSRMNRVVSLLCHADRGTRTPHYGGLRGIAAPPAEVSCYCTTLAHRMHSRQPVVDTTRRHLLSKMPLLFRRISRYPLSVLVW